MAFIGSFFEDRSDRDWLIDPNSQEMIAEALALHVITFFNHTSQDWVEA